MVKDMISELKKYNLLGRSGSGFSTALKWELVKNYKADKKYIICNAAEGEPKNFKDKFILENYPEIVIQGIKEGLKTIDNSSAFIYLKKDYYKKFGNKLKNLSRDFPIKITKKQGNYLSGEETVICEVLEGNRPEPRIKPPFPSEKGLWGYPTLVNNVETFYCVGKISQGRYKKTRFYTITGDVKNKEYMNYQKVIQLNRFLKKQEIILILIFLYNLVGEPWVKFCWKKN